MVGFNNDRLVVYALYPNFAVTPANALFWDVVPAITPDTTIGPADWTVQTPPPSPNIRDILPTVQVNTDVIKITYAAAEEGHHFAAAPFNGLFFGLQGGPPLSNVTLVDTNIPGLTQSNIQTSISGINLAVNVQNLTLPTSAPGYITLQSNFGAPWLEYNSKGLPEMWPRTALTGPTRITVSIQSFPVLNPSVPKAFTSDFYHLVQRAEALWASEANIQFINVSNPADAQICIGLGNLDPGGVTASFRRGQTAPIAADSGTLLQANILLESPNETPLAALPGHPGDYYWPQTGSLASLGTAIAHEFGHALGLGHNLTDPNSLMAPGFLRPSSGTLPDAADIAGLRALYGPPPGT